MRVLFTTTGHAGHLLPLLPFARAAAGAGHDVRIAAQASRVGAVEAAGFDAVPVAEAPPESWLPVRARVGELPLEAGNAEIVRDWFAGHVARAALPALLQAVEDWRPDLVLRETFEFAGAIAAERHGVPVARVALGTERTEEWATGLAAPTVDGVRAQLGLARDPGGARLRRAPLFTLTPARFEQPAGRVPAVVHRFRAGKPAARVLEPGAPPLVYLTLGSVASSLPYYPGFYRAAIAAVAALPVRLLVTLGHGTDAAALGPLPANVEVAAWVPQDEVLARAAAVVGHGGYGTTLGALAHGVPLVVVPLFSSDQWHNAARVAALGAGIALEGAPRAVMAAPGADVLAALPGAVATVLAEPAYRRAARAVAASIAALPPAHAAAPLLERLVPIATTR